MTKSTGHFQSFLFSFFPSPDPKSEKKSRKSTNKNHLALFQILQKYNTEFIQHIEDISDFVHEQKKILDKDKKHGEDHIQVAKETVYTVADEKLAAQIELDHFVPRQPVEPDEPVP